MLADASVALGLGTRLRDGVTKEDSAQWEADAV